ncbi:Signal transduction histidine-protein kinase/phosphatase DegS [Streptomyces rubrolavendulae]|uniref:Oxygen sensor histidine kinase NreB n=2 Tax=Streptomyces rubrolavendulae TaxID=285473 RepID=A0A1D8G919_9ACTN|nr:Signal transduction histidine-protein kinase/phosphatase DegS [Streptomyces rubrolavendulae]
MDPRTTAHDSAPHPAGPRAAAPRPPSPHPPSPHPLSPQSAEPHSAEPRASVPRRADRGAAAPPAARPGTDAAGREAVGPAPDPGATPAVGPGPGGARSPEAPGRTPAPRVLRLGLHLLMAGLLALAAVRAAAAGDAARAAAVAGASALVGAVYAAGPALRSVRTSRRAASVWLGGLCAAWIGLLVLTPDALWVAFPLYFLQLHLLPVRRALPAVAATAAAAVLAYVGHGASVNPGVFVGPPLGAAFAVATVLGYQALYRENERRRRLIDELVSTRAELAAAERHAGTLAERERLAREIHDTLAQGLSSIQLLLRAAERALPPGSPAAAHIERAREEAQGNLAEARRFVRALTPPDLQQGSLVAALERLCAPGAASGAAPTGAPGRAPVAGPDTAAVAGPGAAAEGVRPEGSAPHGGAPGREAPDGGVPDGRAPDRGAPVGAVPAVGAAGGGPRVRFSLSGTPVPLPTPYEVALLRIAQSALANTVRHAAAGRAEVTLTFMDESVTLDVVDDGSGFDPAARVPSADGGFGLPAMRARAESLGGTFTVESAPGQGTALAVALPLLPPGAAA